GPDAFLIKYNPNGEVAWSRQFGSDTTDWGRALWADQSGNVFVSGYTRGSLEAPHGGGYYDIFMRKYDSNGNLLWGRQVPRGTSDQARSIWGDNRGTVIAGGWNHSVPDLLLHGFDS